MLMLEDFWRRFYYTGMKNKIIFTIFGIIACRAIARLSLLLTTR